VPKPKFFELLTFNNHQNTLLKALQNIIARNEVLKVRRRRDKAIPYARPAQNMRLP